MAAYICEYFDISPDWLLLSRGGYFRTAPTPSIFISEGPGSTEYKQHIQNYRDYLSHQANDTKSETLLTLIKDKDQTIRNQAEEIGRLKEQIRQMTIEKEKHVSDAPISGTANVG